jgi:hypothetical protein
VVPVGHLGDTLLGSAENPAAPQCRREFQDGTIRCIIPNNSWFRQVGRTLMNIPEIFLHELWETWWWWICVGPVGLSICVLIRLASRRRTFYNGPESFPELAAFTKDDQQRLLREASREAFGALSFVPVLVFLAFWWGAPALGMTLRKVTVPAWVVIVLLPVFLGLGHWLARRLEAHRVRPFLKKRIDRQNSKTVA